MCVCVCVGWEKDRAGQRDPRLWELLKGPLGVLAQIEREGGEGKAQWSLGARSVWNLDPGEGASGAHRQSKLGKDKPTNPSLRSRWSGKRSPHGTSRPAGHGVSRSPVHESFRNICCLSVALQSVAHGVSIKGLRTCSERGGGSPRGRSLGAAAGEGASPRGLRPPPAFLELRVSLGRARRGLAFNIVVPSGLPWWFSG